MTYQPRDYQRDLIRQIFSAWSEGYRRLMLQLPTGAGKTVLFSAITRHYAHQMGSRVLVVAHREELIYQAQEKLEAVAEVPCGLIKAGRKPFPLATIQIASVQTLMNREFPQANLVIIDEAHHAAAASYLKVMDHYSNSCILGVTATPIRADGRGFEGIFDKLILGTTVAQLIAAGHLCNYRLFAAKNPIVVPDDTKVVGGEYDLAELGAIDMKAIFGDLLKEWRSLALGKKTVVFAVSVEHSQIIAQMYCQNAIPAEHIDGEMGSEQRQAILARFRAGITLVLCNCSIVSEGFDLPDIEAVQCVRPTRSLGLWLQLLGRALRPALGKEYAIVLDHTENWKGHGLPDQERIWSLEGVKAKGALAVECPHCKHVFSPADNRLNYATCPACGGIVEIEALGSKGYQESTGAGRRKVREVDADLREIDTVTFRKPAINYINELVGAMKMRGRKPGWAVNKFLTFYSEVSLREWQYLANALGYKPGWAWHQYLKSQTK